MNFKTKSRRILFGGTLSYIYPPDFRLNEYSLIALSTKLALKGRMNIVMYWYQYGN